LEYVYNQGLKSPEEILASVGDEKHCLEKKMARKYLTLIETVEPEVLIEYQKIEFEVQEFDMKLEQGINSLIKEIRVPVDSTTVDFTKQVFHKYIRAFAEICMMLCKTRSEDSFNIQVIDVIEALKIIGRPIYKNLSSLKEKNQEESHKNLFHSDWSNSLTRPLSDVDDIENDPDFLPIEESESESESESENENESEKEESENESSKLDSEGIQDTKLEKKRRKRGRKRRSTNERLRRKRRN